MECLCSRRRRAVHRLGQAAARTCWSGPAARDPCLVVHGDEPSERLEDVRMGGPAPPRGYGAASARDAGSMIVMREPSRHRPDWGPGGAPVPVPTGSVRPAPGGAARYGGRGSEGEPAPSAAITGPSRRYLPAADRCLGFSSPGQRLCAAGSGREAAEATGRLASGDADGERGRGAADGEGVPGHGMRATAGRGGEQCAPVSVTGAGRVWDAGGRG